MYGQAWVKHTRKVSLVHRTRFEYVRIFVDEQIEHILAHIAHREIRMSTGTATRTLESVHQAKGRTVGDHRDENIWTVSKRRIWMAVNFVPTIGRFSAIRSVFFS